MTDDQADDPLVPFALDDEGWAYYQRRAEAAGRTLEEQLRYELAVLRGNILPDPGDTEATQFGQMFRRMHSGRIVQG